MRTSYESEQIYPEALVNYEETVDNFLRKNLIDIIAIPDDKFRIKALKSIIEFEKVNIDCYDMRRYSGRLETDEYVDLLGKSRTNLSKAVGYIDLVNEAIKFHKKEERELKRLEFQDTKLGKVLYRIFGK